MGVVTAGDGSMDLGGKPLPPEGEFKYIFNGVAEMCGNDGQSLRIEAVYSLDPDNTKEVSCFCYLGAEKGLKSLMSIIVDSGVYKKLMAKNSNLPDPKQGWDEDLVLKQPDFIKQLGVDLIGCEIMFTTKNEEYEYEDKKGVKRTGSNARVKFVRACDGSSATGASVEDEPDTPAGAWG